MVHGDLATHIGRDAPCRANMGPGNGKHLELASPSPLCLLWQRIGLYYES